MKINVKVVNAFSINNTGGNPAGIVLNADELKKQEKQLIASKMGISEIAFVSKSMLADFKLDFFTPVKQIAHCGHATIATFSYLRQIGEIKHNASSKETIDGVRNIYFKEADTFMEQKSPTYQQPQEFINEILASLHLKQSGIINNIEPIIVNTGNSFLIIPVKSEDVLQQINPDFDKIRRISEQFGLVGYYVFTGNVANKEIDATARMFAPLYGINEESATGMAAGPLGCYLHDNGIGKTSINIEQGKFMDKPSTSLVKVDINVKDGKTINLFAGGGAYVSSERIVEI